MLIVDGILVPTRDHAVAEQSKNYRYSTNHRVVIDADIRLVVAVGRTAGGVARSRPSPVGGPPRVSDQAARQGVADLLVGQGRCGVAVRTATWSTSM
ncbi:hypothetical protein GCM10010309_63000 [Streptomyces violaceochromogenes]|nr:hypothetical protein GCM10010309_63000 [Streptomyces violaceochromogenes]